MDIANAVLIMTVPKWVIMQMKEKLKEISIYIQTKLNHFAKTKLIFKKNSFSVAIFLKLH